MTCAQLLACSTSQSVVVIACCLRASLCFSFFGSTNFVDPNAQAHLLVMSLIATYNRMIKHL